MSGKVELRLTYEGWERYHNLTKQTQEGNTAFMAMAFNDTELDQLVQDCLKPAIKDTGFNLIRLDDNPQAGPITDRMKIEIRRSAFLIADLTHHNNGAYWEAGFAEGIGKPVIYMCKKSVFDDEKVHFDIRHHQTILWNSEQPEAIAEELKTIVRSSLPALAKLTDD